MQLTRSHHYSDNPRVYRNHQSNKRLDSLRVQATNSQITYRNHRIDSQSRFLQREVQFFRLFLLDHRHLYALRWREKIAIITINTAAQVARGIVVVSWTKLMRIIIYPFPHLDWEAVCKTQETPWIQAAQYYPRSAKRNLGLHLNRETWVRDRVWMLVRWESIVCRHQNSRQLLPDFQDNNNYTWNKVGETLLWSWLFWVLLLRLESQ